MNRFKKISIYIALPLIVVLIVLGLYGERVVSALDRNIYRNLKLFTEVLDLVEKNYVEEVDSKALIQGAVNGMLKSLDPHSVFLTPEMYKELKVDTEGRFGGVGIEITLVKDVLTVVAPIEDTPAYLAGVKAADQIIKIDGNSTKDITITEAVKKLRGTKGTKVTITIMREGEPAPFDITITRAEIKVRSVRSKTYEGNYGYIRIAAFQERTADDVRLALQEMDKKMKPFRGLIIDLRNNPGGLLPQAIDVSDTFLKSGIIVSTKGRVKGMDTRATARDQGGEPSVPLVVLLNEGSASAAEIVAGALQGNKRATVIGTRSFGKASVQTIIPLEGGNALKLTTAKYYTPDGRSIHGAGIIPDLEIKFIKPANEKETDDLLRDNQLRGALDHLKAMTGGITKAGSQTLAN